MYKRKRARERKRGKNAPPSICAAFCHARGVVRFKTTLTISNHILICAQHEQKLGEFSHRSWQPFNFTSLFTVPNGTKNTNNKNHITLTKRNGNEFTMLFTKLLIHFHEIICKDMKNYMCVIFKALFLA